MVGGFHVAGALTADRFPGLATTLHAIGTTALGGGIALAGQIFNLDEHWPSGILLWGIGAAAGWLVLRQVPQLALLAALAPAWLVSEWMVAVGERFEPAAMRVAACGVFLCAVAYLTTRPRGAIRRCAARVAVDRRARAAAGVACAGQVRRAAGGGTTNPPASLLSGLYLTGWTIAIGLPLALAVAVRRGDAWIERGGRDLGDCAGRSSGHR